LAKTPEYAGVQCVSCHGRMGGHIAFHSGSPDKSNVTRALLEVLPEFLAGSFDKSEAEVVFLARPYWVTRNICLQCHTPEFDDDFDFKRDKKMVH
jgi:hypothetical protein